MPILDDAGKPLNMVDIHDYNKESTGAFANTYFLNWVAGKEYEHKIGKDLHAQGIQKADIIPLPINKRIIGECIQDVVTIATEIAQGNKPPALVARNLRALFHVPIARTNTVSSIR